MVQLVGGFGHMIRAGQACAVVMASFSGLPPDMDNACKLFV